MSARNSVWIERINGAIVRIFKSTHSDDWKKAMAAGTLETCSKKDAVGSIWEQLWIRAAGKCEYGCGRTITRTGWNKAEMHEEVPRGNGGEISLSNSKMICRTCHRTSDRAHGDRRPQWNSKSFEEVMEGE